MLCKQAHRIPDFIRRKISDQEKLEIEAHVRTCSSCQRDVQTISNTFATINTNQVWKPAEAYWTNFNVHVNKRILQKRTPWYQSEWSLKLVIPAVAATFLVVLLTSIDFIPGLQSSGEAPSSGIAPILSTSSDTELKELISLSENQSFSETLSNTQVSDPEAVDEAVRDEETKLFSDASLNDIISMDEIFSTKDLSIESLSQDETDEILQRLTTLL